MSHTTSLTGFKIDDFEALKEAVLSIQGASMSEQRSVKLYGSNVVHDTIAAVKLPGMHYPLAVTEGGEIKYDSYRSERGWEKELDNFKQRYSAFKTLLAAKKAVRFKKILEPKKLADGWLEATLVM